MKRLRLKSGGKAELSQTVTEFINSKMGKLNEGDGVAEIERTTKLILSEIKYTAMTGIQPFDDLVGGFPFGRVCEVHGLESCGKTALAIRTCVRAQEFHVMEVSRDEQNRKVFTPVDRKKCVVEILYMDNEASIDDAEKITVDGVHLDANVGRCDTVGQLFTMIDQAIQGVRAFRAKYPDLIVLLVVVIDTVASTSSQDELESDYGKVDFPRHAKQLRQCFRKMIRDINRNNVLMICTNQVGDAMQQGMPKRKTGLPNADDYRAFGGKALLFYASHRIFMHALVSRYKLVPDAKFSAGFLISFFSKKNRVLPPLREGRMVLLTDPVKGGLSNEFSILETMIYLGFAEVKTKTKGTHIRFLFKKWGITTTTWNKPDETVVNLEDEDISKEEEDADDNAADGTKPSKRSKDPVMYCRADWPAFYAEHKADFDALYHSAIDYASKTAGIDGRTSSVEDEDELSEVIELED